MRLSAIAAAVVGAGVAQVAASPIRLIIAPFPTPTSSTTPTSVSSPDTGADNEAVGHVHVRLGHAVPLPILPGTWPRVEEEEDKQKIPIEGMGVGMGAIVAPPPPSPPHGPGFHRKPCRGRSRLNKLRQKSLEISNKFRAFLGLPLIEAAHPFHPHHPHHGHGHHGHNVKPVNLTHLNVHTVGVGEYKILPVSELPAPHRASQRYGGHGYNYGYRHGKFPHPRPFVERLNHALLHLGRWEGRAVAFVLGCGIGVLLRLVFVMSVLAIRAVRGQREDERERGEYSPVFFVEEYDEPHSAQSPPPIYVYPVDEKAAIKGEEEEVKVDKVKEVKVEGEEGEAQK